MATKYSAFFKRDTRNDGEAFVTLTDDHPEWLKDAIYEAHRETFPNDWIYEECFRAVEAFDAGELTDTDDAMSYTDARVDVYTRDLFQWAADFCLTDTWSEAEAEASDAGLPDDMVQRLTCIQYAAIRHIAETMRDACAQASEESEEQATAD